MNRRGFLKTCLGGAAACLGAGVAEQASAKPWGEEGVWFVAWDGEDPMLLSEREWEQQRLPESPQDVTYFA